MMVVVPVAVAVMLVVLGRMPPVLPVIARRVPVLVGTVTRVT